MNLEPGISRDDRNSVAVEGAGGGVPCTKLWSKFGVSAPHFHFIRRREYIATLIHCTFTLYIATLIATLISKPSEFTDQSETGWEGWSTGNVFFFHV